MNRFSNIKSSKYQYIWKLFCFIAVVVFLFLYIFGANTLNRSTIEEQAKSLESTVRKSIAQCYAIEGTYPPDLNYLRQHYGLIYDEDIFYIDYTVIGSNIMPDVTIISKIDP